MATPKTPPQVAGSHAPLPDGTPLVADPKTADSSSESLPDSRRGSVKPLDTQRLRSNSQPIALGIRNIAPQTRSATGHHTRNSSSPSILPRTDTTVTSSSPDIPDISPQRLSRYMSRLSYQESVDSRLSMDASSRPTPPLISPTRSSARHSRTLSGSSNASGSLRGQITGDSSYFGRGHSRQQSAVSMASSASDLRQQTSLSLDSSVKSLQPRQYNYPEDATVEVGYAGLPGSFRPVSVLRDSVDQPVSPTQKHSDVRKAPPIRRKSQQSRASQVMPGSPRQSKPPGSPRRDQQPQMTSVWLDDDSTRLNRSRSVASKPIQRSSLQPTSKSHRKHKSLSQNSPRTPKGIVTPVESSQKQNKVTTPSEASRRLASATSANTTATSFSLSSNGSAQSTPSQSSSPHSRTPSSLRRLIGNLSPLRFSSSRKSASPQPEPSRSQQSKPLRRSPAKDLTKTPPPSAPMSSPSNRKRMSASGNLQAAIDFNNAHRNLNPARTQRPHSMVLNSPKQPLPPTGTPSQPPDRPARPSPKELLDATDMRRLSTDFNRLSLVYSPSIPQSPSLAMSPAFTGPSSPRLSMVAHEKRCFSAVSTLSNESAPSTRTGSRSSLLADGNVFTRSPQVELSEEASQVLSTPLKAGDGSEPVMEFQETWI